MTYFHLMSHTRPVITIHLLCTFHMPVLALLQTNTKFQTLLTWIYKLRISFQAAGFVFGRSCSIENGTYRNRYKYLNRNKICVGEEGHYVTWTLVSLVGSFNFSKCESNRFSL